MFLIVVCIQFVVQVLSEAPPAPPQNVHVDGWLMTWTPAAEDRDVTYTVQYSSNASKKWTDVQACFRISANQCDVHEIKDQSTFGCVMLRVRAERRGLNSDPVEACGTRGDSCIPEVSLTARPGYLTVHLSRNHSLAREYADHAGHRVHYGREGEPLEQNFKDGVSSLSIEGLQEGQRYCAKVQFLHFSEPTGLPRCPQCELIPNSSHSGQAEIIVPVVLVLVLVVLTPVITYVLLFHCGTIKQWLRRTRYEIPDFLYYWPPNHAVDSSPCEEHTDVVSSVTVA